MDSFEAKIGWKRIRKTENKNYRSVPTRCEIEISKRIAKKFRKLKNTIMASFLSKIGVKRPRKTENKNYRFVSFQPGAKYKIKKKIAKKLKKKIKTPLWIHLKPKQVGKG